MATDNELKEVRVTDMYLTCMYPVVPNAIAASGCCGRLADTIVERPDRSTAWRCPEHRGLIKGGITGPARETMLTYQVVSDDIVLSRPTV